MEMSKEVLDKMIAVVSGMTGFNNYTDGAGRVHVLVPEGFSRETIEPVDRALPEDIIQAVEVDTSESLIKYVELFRETDTRLFVSRTVPSMTAVFNYHSASDAPEKMSNAPRYCSHKVVWKLPASLQYRRWSELARYQHSQTKILEFFEENGEDVINPSGAQMFEMLGKVSSRKKTEFISGFRLSDGSVEVAFKEEGEATAGIKRENLPSEFNIGIPIFVDGPTYEVRVMLRYRIDEGKLAFQVVLHRIEILVDDAIKDEVSRIESATSLEAIFGKAAGVTG